MKKINGLTSTQWAKQLFEFENCTECHRGENGHDIVEFVGNWFAQCKKNKREHTMKDNLKFNDKRINSVIRQNNLLPAGVPKYIRVFDNGGVGKKGGTFDRYTVVYTHADKFGLQGYTIGVGMSTYPFSPQGFGQHFEYKNQDYNGRSGGKKITFQDLPEDCKRLVLIDYREYWEV